MLTNMKGKDQTETFYEKMKKKKNHKVSNFLKPCHGTTLTGKLGTP